MEPAGTFGGSGEMPIIGKLQSDLSAIFGAALELACAELGISHLSLDVWKRERVSQLIQSLMDQGESNVDELARQAVVHFLDAGWDHR
jgi:hypothetical protein